MASFEKAIKVVMEHEGGYVLTSILYDKGGDTFAGISRRANPEWEGWPAIEAGYTDPDLEGIKQLHGQTLRQLVDDLYWHKYWTPLGLPLGMPQLVADCLLSCAVLSGPRMCLKIFQAATDKTPDGLHGPQTSDAMEHLCKADNVELHDFMVRFMLMRIMRYARIVRDNPKQSKFLVGWINRSIEDAG